MIVLSQYSVRLYCHNIVHDCVVSFTMMNGSRRVNETTQSMNGSRRVISGSFAKNDIVLSKMSNIVIYELSHVPYSHT